MTLGRVVIVLVGSIVVIAGALAALYVSARENPTFVAHTDPTLAGVAGVVVDENGKPVSGLRVTWFALDSSAGVMTNAFRGGEFEAVTAADGSFRFDAVPPVEGYAALAGRPPSHEGETGFLVPRTGLVATDLTLRARSIPATRFLRGRLLDPAGKPVAGAMVLARHQGWFGTWQFGAVTDAAGSFVIVAPDEGATARLIVTANGSERSLGEVTFGQDVQLTVEPR